jgi:hypothetical protein
VGIICGVEWPEDFIQRVKEDTMGALAAMSRALNLFNEIINEDVELRQWSVSDTMTLLVTWQGFRCWCWKRCGCPRVEHSCWSIRGGWSVSIRVRTMRWRIPI